MLRAAANRYAHALVVFDREGCGHEALPREKVENMVEQKLSRTGWGDRASVIVLDPELEVWVWSDSPHVESILGWRDRSLGLLEWLFGQGFLRSGQAKPERPKEAMIEALRTVRKPRSSSLYQQLAQKVSLQRCIDPSFVKFKDTMRRWFGVD